MRIGIKSEIHSCTVDFVKEYLMNILIRKN